MPAVASGVGSCAMASGMGRPLGSRRMVMMPTLPP